MRSNELLRKPLWPPSGRLLPQHRQFPDVYGELFASQCVAATAPPAWGVASLRISKEALPRGVFQVTEAIGRFPSGAPLVVGAGHSLSRHLPSGRTAVTISAGLARVWPDAPNVTEDSEDTAAVRYLRVRSANGSSLLPNVRLLLDDEGDDRYERVPLARVSMLGKQGTVEPWFLPPLLRIWPDSTLEGAVRQLVLSLEARRAALLASRDARPLDLRTLAPSSMTPVLLLSAINEALAVLDRGDLSTYLPPRALHECLAALVGALDVLDGRPANECAPHVHEAPGPSFRAIFERLLAIVPGAVREPHRAFPLRRVDDVTFSLTIEEPDVFRRKVFLVAAGVDESALATHLPAFAKLGSDLSLPVIVNTATRGAPIALEFDPPPSIPSSARHCAFRVDTRSDYWVDALARRSLFVHVPQAPPELTLTMYVLTTESA